MQHLERFERDAGPITWDPAALAECELGPELSRVLHVASVLEEDTAISARQARALGLDRDPDMAGFLTIWEQEEAEHGRALRHLLGAQRYDLPQLRPTLAPLRRHGLASIPLTGLRRVPATGLVVCALGAAAEYVAIVIYTELIKQTDDPRVVTLLRSIVRQEGRHMAFFLAAARSRADDMSTVQGRLSRWAIARIWEPVGLPSLGEQTWHTTLAPLLSDQRVRGRAEKMDHVLDSITHLAGMQLMTTFLRTHPAPTLSAPATTAPDW